MLERTFTEEQYNFEESTATDQGRPEYDFEGYNVEFSEKVMLTFPAPKRSALTAQQTVS